VKNFGQETQHRAIHYKPAAISNHNSITHPGVPVIAVYAKAGFSFLSLSQVLIITLAAQPLSFIYGAHKLDYWDSQTLKRLSN
jgi:hypothetical protein